VVGTCVWCCGGTGVASVTARASCGWTVCAREWIDEHCGWTTCSSDRHEPLGSHRLSTVTPYILLVVVCHATSLQHRPAKLVQDHAV